MSITVKLRWKALRSAEWSTVSNAKRSTFARSKGKKNPPVRGADIEGHYYLDLYENGKRRYHFLNLKSGRNGRSNDETERIAREVARNYHNEEWRLKHGFASTLNGRIEFVEFFRTLVPGRHRAWRTTLIALEDFPDKNSPLDEIDYNWLSAIQRHLLSRVSQNSASTYYAKIKAALQIAVQQELISSNPASKIKAIQQVASQRTYLTKNELQVLAKTPCQNPEVKRAFLFACYAAGLRYSDLQALTWGKVQEGRLELRIIKTKEPEWIDLSPIALKLLGESKGDSEPVFALPSSEWVAWNTLQKWATSAGIKKHVTAHVARHTFATLALEATGDIYLVSKLIGHSSIQHTQVYAKIVDSRKRSAMMSLPEIELS